MVNWDALEKMGVSKTSLEQQGLLDSMLKGYKTNKLVPLTLTLTGARVKLDARLSFITMPDGQIGLGYPRYPQGTGTGKALFRAHLHGRGQEEPP